MYLVHFRCLQYILNTNWKIEWKNMCNLSKYRNTEWNVGIHRLEKMYFFNECIQYIQNSNQSSIAPKRGGSFSTMTRHSCYCQPFLVPQYFNQAQSSPYYILYIWCAIQCITWRSWWRHWDCILQYFLLDNLFFFGAELLFNLEGSKKYQIQKCILNTF